MLICCEEVAGCFVVRVQRWRNGEVFSEIVGCCAGWGDKIPNLLSILSPQISRKMSNQRRRVFFMQISSPAFPFSFVPSPKLIKAESNPSYWVFIILGSKPK